jgi:Lrp/AsnC family leucine-responsive transcriptional regulator
MRFGPPQTDIEPDAIDLQLLDLLQDDCRTSLAQLGTQVGLSPPSVLERVKKLEQAGFITGYHAALDARRLGLDVTAFIGVVTSAPDRIAKIEEKLMARPDVLEVHHVTGEFTLLLKVKTANTSTLEDVISGVRSLPGVVRTETSIVLSTHTERTHLALPSLADDATTSRRPRRNGARNGNHRRPST